MPITDKDAIQMAAPDYGVDQIIGYFDGSFSLAAGGPGSSETFGFASHDTGFNDTCLTTGLFSIDGGTSWINNGASYPNGEDPVVGMLDVAFTISSDVDGSVSASATNTTTSAYTVMYKIALMAKSDQGAITPLPSAQTLSYKTDLNYMKASSVGTVTVAPSTSQSVAHDLGYVPNFLVWRGRDENDPGDNRILLQAGPSSAIIDSTNLTLINSSSTASRKFYYKVYLDD